MKSGESEKFYLIILVLILLILPFVYSGIFQNLIYYINGSQNNEAVGSNIIAGFDFHGDGYNDLIISGGTRDVVYVYAGTAVGDLHSNITTAQDVTRFVGATNTNFGGNTTNNQRGSSFIQDFNGDSLADVLVVAPYADPSGVTDAGQAFVFFGVRLPQTNWSYLNANLTLNGTATNGRLGIGISGIRDFGDFNGDGYSDVLLPIDNNDTSFPGAYVIYGANGYPHGLNVNITTYANITLNYHEDLNPTPNTVVLGDINNDGLDDFAMGFSTGGPFLSRGQVFIFFGNITGNATQATVTSLQSNITINGSANNDRLNVHGYIGDWNNDSVDDFILGARGASRGILHMFFGRTGLGNILVNNPFTYSNITINGSSGDILFGTVASSTIGDDVNNDGINDLIFSDANASSGGNRTRIQFGVNGMSTFGLSINANTANFSINGSSDNLLFGIGVAPWDFDNDTIKEIVVGDPAHAGGGTTRGQVRVFEILDINAPSLIVNTPDGNSIFTSTNLSLNVTVHDNFGSGTSSGLDLCFHSFTDTPNITFNCLQNTTIVAPDCTAVTLSVYANDSAGNTNLSSFSLTVNTSSCTSITSISFTSSEHGGGGGGGGGGDRMSGEDMKKNLPKADEILRGTPFVIPGTSLQVVAPTFNEKYAVVSIADAQVPFESPIAAVTQVVDKVVSEVTPTAAEVSFVSSAGESLGTASVSFVQKNGVSVPRLDLLFYAFDKASTPGAINTPAPISGKAVDDLKGIYYKRTNLHSILILFVIAFIFELVYGIRKGYF